jgi:hypothetical protein
MAKAFLKSPNGGAFATIASSTQPNADTEEIMSRAFWQKAQTGSTLGEAMRFSKQAVYDNDVRLSYHTFGDPTAKYFSTN